MCILSRVRATCNLLANNLSEGNLAQRLDGVKRQLNAFILGEAFDSFPKLFGAQISQEFMAT